VKKRFTDQLKREEKDQEEARSSDGTKQLWKRSVMLKRHQWSPHLLRPDQIFSSPICHGLVRIFGSPPLLRPGKILLLIVGRLGCGLSLPWPGKNIRLASLANAWQDSSANR
jgi:hypothetical protein